MIVLVAVLWVATLWRLPSAILHPARRRLWFVYASKAVAFTVGLPEVMDAMSRWPDLPGPAHLTKYLFGIIGCWAFLTWLTATKLPVRPRWLAHRHLVTLTVGLLITVIFIALDNTPDSEFALRAQESPLVVAYIVIFDVFLGLTLAAGAVIYRSCAKMTSECCVRTGVWFLCVGTVLGAIYAVADIAILTVDFLHRGSDTTPTWAYPTVALFSNTAVLLAVAGIAIPPAGQALTRLRDRYRLVALRPIWWRLTSHVPDIAPRDRPRLRDDLTRPDLQMGLLRRTLELHDARLFLRSRLSAQEHQTIAETLHTRGLTGDKLASAIDAATLRAGITALTQGRTSNQQVLEPATGGSDLSADVRLFLAIRRADRSPDIAEAAQRAVTTAEPDH